MLIPKSKIHFSITQIHHFLIYRFEKRHKNMSVHLSPCFRDVQPGDVVTVGECRYGGY